MPRRSNSNYLFSQGDLGATLRGHFQKIQECVDAIPEQRFRDSPEDQLLKEIQEQLLISPLELDEAKGTMSREETKVDVSGDPRRVFLRGEGPAYVPGFRVRISVPYRGEHLLWQLQPSSWRTTFPRGIVRPSSGTTGGALEIVIDHPADENPEKIKESFDRTMDDVRFYVQNQKTQIEGENARLPSLTRSAITRRQEKLQRHRGRCV
jgi:hypothetical protein